MSQHDDLFDLVDACDLRVPDKRTITERPDLLELYTRRPRRIEPRHIKSDWVAGAAFVLAFGTIIFMSLVMCL
ncbi:hypothetical protein I6H48_07500 [Corynebacterium amycolatum]|uniref:Uncharacterized protein n=1 Tax=Corynebacterium amycolatum TaxID=43765 RepID=A0AB37G788_CORAY|nr:MULTISPECIES: hypothetical protein [Corynebacterium]MDU3110471.1 hypothetical protein [Corynebacterium sp.]QPR29987.1 hypothetical protein I6G95_06940 [Corynebacterium amycolatum]QQB81823.1 hypothetical protein I6H48_07500 [Corynebacterium amycolatum]